MTRFAAAMLVVAALTGCTGTTDTSPSTTPSTPRPTARTPTSTPSAAPSRSVTPSTASVHPVSMRALMQKQYDGRDLRLGRVLARTSAYTRYAATYRSGKLTISGIVNVPRGSGPFPAVVLNHGYIDPAIYTTGRGLAREQDYLARQGFLVLHTDYRNHAGSSKDPGNDLRLRTGYVEDAINAVLAVKRFALADPERVGMLGRSMGGGITYAALVAQPDIVDAAVVYASTPADVGQNFNHFVRRSPERNGLARAIIRAYGAPETNPGFWRNASPITYFDRVRVPLLLHHGTSDDTCPIAWSRAAHAELQRLGKESTLFEYRGEEHAFGPQWTLSVQRTVSFLRRHLAM